MNGIQRIDLNNLGELQSVSYKTEPLCNNDLTEICLMFDGMVFIITVDPEDDTIIFTTQQTELKENISQNKNGGLEKLIPSLLRRSVQWIWSLTNQQGYCDGIQLEFFDRSRDSDDSIIVQFLAVASGIKVSTVIEGKL